MSTHHTPASITTLPYGHWPSPISAALLATQGLRMSEPQICGDYVYWLESRPLERGRTTLMRLSLIEDAAEPLELLPAPHSLRTRAHEYGGGAYLVTEEYLFLVLDSDQRIYYVALSDLTLEQLSTEPFLLKPLSPEGQYRYADFCFDAQRQRLIAVREDYGTTPHNPPNHIIAIDLTDRSLSLLATGADFYSNPRLSPCGKRLAYLRWNHPQMPWDGSECLCAELDAQGAVINAQLVAGSDAEAVVQPEWSPRGELIFISDRSNWWNIYRWDGHNTHTVFALDAEFAGPRWVFGMSYYGFLNADNLACCYNSKGQWQLGEIDLINGVLNTCTTNLRDISSLQCSHQRAVFIGASKTQGPQLYRYDSDARANKHIAQLSQHTLDIDPAYFSAPDAITFPTTDGEECHGFFYAPLNPAASASANSLPPLLVMCHGGPTAATESSLNVKIQFWTSRGFAVLDVNYRGSSGYGRRYRDRLKHNWGITDVIDVCSGAQHLVERGLVDPEQLAIRGSSAGGYTVLAALTFGNTFKVGASLYGISDLAALAQDTHKFEAHYLDSLVGPYPAQQETYTARSPIHHIEQLNCPVIFLQGLQDKVVPPAQAEAMVAALTAKRIYTEYVTFAEEGHGFRQGENIEQALTAELNFYLKIFAQNK